MLVYVAHPLGGNIDRNVERVKRWLAFLVTREPNVSFVVPWLPYVDVFRSIAGPRQSDQGHPLRDRFMRDNLEIARAIGATEDGGIVLCGPRCSTGMGQEWRATHSEGGWVSDLILEHADPLEVSLDRILENVPILQLGRKRFTRRHAEDPSVYG